MEKIATKSKRTGVLFIIAALVIALLAAGLTYMTVNKFVSKAPVWVVNAPIQKGDPLNADKFTTKEVPKASIQKGTLKPGTDLTGYAATVEMLPGDVLKEGNIIKLAQSDDVSILSARLKALNDKNLVAGEIPLDSIKGMLSGMKTGDKISIVNVYTEDKVLKSETIINYCDTIGVRSPGEDSSGAIIVALTREQSEILAMARERGKVYAYLLPYGTTKDDVAAVKKAETPLIETESTEN